MALAIPKKTSRSPRMRHFASKLATITISLDPPSPPHVSPSLPSRITTREELSFDLNYLQVPAEIDAQRSSSPPPDRRGSYASTLSDNSSITIPMSSSYQSLLSPMWTSIKYSIDECETPPNELSSRPRSAQERIGGNVQFEFLVRQFYNHGI
ncbi:hypothetical protein NECAME_09903 [Necator americanus]|uniref:Uncharacterized protein n=1 Tax=Necator americanus TaxID=51031 RepID=W2TEA8_NECAM|nr:hypothetical protein NECAME_09903 [Necator americanus]ETN79327.1 hypothetical protein NECAME_09903 [Necator americanus]